MPVTQATFQQAVRAHQAGRLAEAERLYRHVLSLDSRHPDALHLLGVIATQVGRHDEAVRLIGSAIALKGDVAAFHANLGSGLRALGRLGEAAQSYRNALKINKSYAEAHNNLGTTLRDLGDPAQAEEHYRAALGLRPDYAEAHNNLGGLLRETGRLAEAEAGFRKALQFAPLGHPKSVAFNRNLGALLRETGRLEEAEQAWRRALRIDPSDPESHHGLGLTLRDQSRLADAERSFRTLLALSPFHVESWTSLAAILRVRDRPAEAEFACRRALSLDEGFADAHATLGTVALDLGRLDEARRHLQRALEIRPDEPLYHFNIGPVKRYSPDDPDLARMEALRERQDRLGGEQRIHLHFALAKAREDVGDRDRSFDLLRTANRLKRETVRYDEAAELSRLASIREVLDRDFMAARAEPTAPPDGPIFIVGMPRSGSTLVEQILASHPRVHGAGEVQLLRKAMEEVLGSDGYPGQAPALARDDFLRLGRKYAADLSAGAPAGLRVTDKLLRNFEYCGLIHLALPGARIIHTRRDPVDTCLSIFSRMFVGDIPYAYDLGELGRYYRFYRDLMDHWRRVLPAGVMIDVDYEDVVSDLGNEARAILAHCGLPWDDACLSFHRTERPVRTASASQVRQPIYRSSVGKWRPPADLLAPLLDQLG